METGKADRKLDEQAEKLGHRKADQMEGRSIQEGRSQVGKQVDRQEDDNG